MTTKQTLKNRLGNLALALALSTGTVGGMMTVALTADVAQAANIAGGNNGGGNNGGGNPAGGNGADGGPAVMNPREPISFVRTPNGRSPRVAAPRSPVQKCEGNAQGTDSTHCRLDARPARIVSMHGFANCALIEQTRYGEFYCARPM